jgi:hypothetical protein
MREGSITDVLDTNCEERKLALGVSKLDDQLSFLREKLRLGERLSAPDLEEALV